MTVGEGSRSLTKQSVPCTEAQLSTFVEHPVSEFDHNVFSGFGDFDGVFANVTGEIANYQLMVVTVPEPSSALLACAGIGMFCMGRSRRLPRHRTSKRSDG